ncbi:PAS domain-containing sensor histidine kinase [Natronomonas halophila]|uniref:PAS domain-containing sensor histidine kinase n=1 Tax=Natronomonas halophila TaxID=2747817 RepID=UPI0015B649AC|nr:PAS domain-containing sensor histidine kinase [Natronomonas halophila]QLD85952.1 PAS domain-containing sensor histidine kinase [Natronomonas halophila]
MNEDGGPEPRDRDWYRALLDAAAEVVVVLDDGTIEYANAAARDVLGYDPESLVGMPITEFVHEDDRDVARDLLADDAAAAVDTELRVHHADGTMRQVALRRSDLPAEGSVEVTVLSLRDVTDRRQREEELATYETIVKTAPVGLFTLDETGDVTWANEVYADALGISRDDLIGTSFEDLVAAGYYAPETVDTYAEHVRTLLSSDNDIEQAKYRVEVHLDGETLVHDAYVALLPLEDGEFQGTVIAFRDVTQQQASQRELQRQNERLDQFASVVSHDLRNPLSVAKGRLTLARKTGEDEHFEAVAEAHERMMSLIDGLLSVAREGRTLENPVSISIASVAEAAWESVDTDAATLTVDDGAGTVTADPERLQRLFENLFRNALDHGGEGVAVTVGTLADDEGFYVADDGPGIPPGDRDRVFEQGYSTSPDGTGFGLRIVDTVAEAHGWSAIAVESEPGGARIEIHTGE